ncbi:hypothetical protein [Methylovulum miyakonense]|uniref:hypothetical protein n=1 Tax=Methylovulum miyakonense TaxID=645578 RepID=UPI00037384BD|nr:hypothetical protein [Methylovulum miyakonense]
MLEFILLRFAFLRVAFERIRSLVEKRARNHIVESTLFELGFPRDDFERIKVIVKENDPLIPTAYLKFDDIYSLEHYMCWKSGKLNVLLDNNIFTRLVYLAKGCEIRGNEEEIKAYRFCCAAMCFFILGKFNIEANVPLYERASQNTHENAINDLYYFRVADHVDASAYAKLALGRANRFSDAEIEDARKTIEGNLKNPEESNFKKQLNDWKLSYVQLLKIVELSKHNDLEKTDQIRKFFDWVIHDFRSSTGPLMFALLFLSPKKPGKMIKNINTKDFPTLIKNIKNAAWDLTYLAELRKRSKNQPDDTIWFFCSQDKLLQRIERLLLLKKGYEIEAVIQNLIDEFWGKSNVQKVYKYYQMLSAPLKSETRREHNKNVLSQTDKMITDLEATIESMMPTQNPSI